MGYMRIPAIIISTILGVGAAAAQPLATPAQNACAPDWRPAFGGAPTQSANVFAVFDDGSGPALYVGGSFSNDDGAPASGIARWDGTSWSPLGEGIRGTVEALTVFDDGSGPALYAGGLILEAGGNPVNNIARWDGEIWAPVGVGLGDSSQHNSQVKALAVFDDGSGAALYAGGRFTVMDGDSESSFARWNGSVWTPLAAFDNNLSPSSFGVFDDGSGPALYAGLTFSPFQSQDEDPLLRWTGAEWVPATTGTSTGSRNITSMIVHDDGAGPALFVSGEFESLADTSVHNIARFDGSGWTPVGDPIDAASTLLGVARALAVFDDGSGPSLYASSISFGDTPGSSFNGIAKWTGDEWSPLVGGLTNAVTAIGVFDDGAGPAIYASGPFLNVGKTPANRLAKWDAAAGWTPVGTGLDGNAGAFAVFNDGRGDALYLGGGFLTADGIAVNGVARYDGETWEPLGTGLDGEVLPFFGAFVRKMIVFDDGSGPALYVAGTFDSVSGVPADGIARWDGAAWSALDGVGDNLGIRSLAVFDDGTGPALHVSGSFSDGAGGYLKRIAKWDGSGWSFIESPVGVSPDTSIYAITVFDDGSGDALYAALLSHVPNDQIPTVAKWDGAEWTNLSGQFAGARLPIIFNLGVFDDGAGEALYAVGAFSNIDGHPALNIARWDGAQWSALAGGLGVVEHESTRDSASSLAVFDRGDGPALVVGGLFQVSPSGDSFLALYQGCAATEPPAPSPDLNSDGIVDGTDLLILLNEFGGPGAADINNDGSVDGTDLLILLNAFGSGGG